MKMVLTITKYYSFYFICSKPNISNYRYNVKSYLILTQYLNGKDQQLETRRMTPTGIERRSAQQLERDNLRQRSFEARRAASQPQLLACDEEGESTTNRPQPQIPTPIRRGSYGNIMEASSVEIEKDSDDGGFLKRIGSNERRLETPNQQTPGPSTSDQREGLGCHNKEDQKQTDALQGTPRKKLEGEIG